MLYICWCRCLSKREKSKLFSLSYKVYHKYCSYYYQTTLINYNINLDTTYPSKTWELIEIIHHDLKTSNGKSWDFDNFELTLLAQNLQLCLFENKCFLYLANLKAFAYSLLTPDCQNWKKYSICDFCFPFRRKIPAICIICSLPYLGISFVYFCKKECMRSNFGQFAGLPDRGHFLTNLQTFGYRLLKSTKLGIGLNLQNSLSKQLSGFFGIQDPIWKHFKCLLLILQISYGISLQRIITLE